MRNTVMPKSCFTSWTELYPNFLQQPLASRKVDSVIANEVLQHEFKHSKNIRNHFMYFDNQIIRDYTQLVDLKLREGFARIEQKDFANPKGFSDGKKASEGVRFFFQIRETLEFFVRDDICSHPRYSSRLNAFRRWLSIADSLLDSYNYDGFHLVMAVLTLIDSQHHLTNNLPFNAKLQFNRLEKLIDESCNHKNLRTMIDSETNSLSLKPVFMYSSDITRLNQAKESVRDNDITLKNISKTDFIQSSKIWKTQLLETIRHRQSISLPPLPEHLVDTYNQMNKLYNDASMRSDLQSPRNSNKGFKIQCTLYRKDLLPSFWARRGVSPEKFWGATLGLTQTQDNKKAP